MWLVYLGERRTTSTGDWFIWEKAEAPEQVTGVSGWPKCLHAPRALALMLTRVSIAPIHGDSGGNAFGKELSWDRYKDSILLTCLSMTDSGRFGCNSLLACVFLWGFFFFARQNRYGTHLSKVLVVLDSLPWQGKLKGSCLVHHAL